MQIQFDKLSKAVVLFVGFGAESSPSQDRSRLIQEFGAAEGATLESPVAALLLKISIHSMPNVRKRPKFLTV